MTTGTTPSNQTGWPHPESLDALIAAPDHHTLLMENESVRVLSTLIAPGDTTPIHTHKWHRVFYIQSWSACIQRDDKGGVIVDTRRVPELADPAKAMWVEPGHPHSVENVGDKDLWLIAVEIKNTAG
ncbi:MAG: cupin domain-containing protein [Anaerolineae bacterium]